MVKKIDNVGNDAAAKRDAFFIQQSLKPIAAFAWKSFLAKGKGAVVIKLTHTDSHKVPDDRTLFSETLTYQCPEMFKGDGFTSAQRSIILDIINSYDPNIGAAVIFLDDKHVNAYKISTNPLPPQAFEELRHLLE